MRNAFGSAVLAAICGLVIGACGVLAGRALAPTSETIEENIAMRTASVTAIDHNTRQVTLTTTDG